MVGLMKYLRYSSKIISCHAQRSISSHTTAIADIQGELSYGELARRALWISEAIKATIHEVSKPVQVSYENDRHKFSFH